MGSLLCCCMLEDYGFFDGSHSMSGYPVLLGRSGRVCSEALDEEIAVVEEAEIALVGGVVRVFFFVGSVL